VDALGEAPTGPTLGGEAPRGGDHPARPREEATFIVARGHPELIDQLRALMGHDRGVQIIEDRRQRPREEATAAEMRELRKRLREEGSADQG
jgi:hypothetical protein